MHFDNYIQGVISRDSIQKELNNFYPYYNTLNTELKSRFVERTFLFIQNKKFVPRQDLFLTEHIVILVSACAVQITFGLSNFLIEHFEYVLIYPDIYNSPITGKRHKGETNISGFICFSWKDLAAGIDNTNDNYNLGLHEWMHALRFNGIKGAESDYFFENYINKWIAASMQEYSKLKNGKTSIFRKYGAENINEFLSVCTEHFFESPAEFEAQAPDLFKQTCILLNQHPGKERVLINVRDKYLFNPSIEATNIEAPLIEIEASFKNTILSSITRFIFYGFAMFLLLTANTSFSNSIAAILTLGAIYFLNGRYYTIQFYNDHIYYQKGFFDTLAIKNSIKYSQIIKIESEDSQFESNFNNLLNIHYYNGYIFETKKLILNSFNIPSREIEKLLTGKNILNKI